MTDSRKHLADAESALALVKTEAQLMAWHDRWMTGADYIELAQEDARTLEALYQRKAGWFMGVMAG